MDLYSRSIISLDLFLNPLLIIPSFLFASFAALQHCLCTSRLHCTITPKSFSLFVQLEKSATQGRIRVAIIKSKVYHQTLIDIACHLPILRPLEQYLQIQSQTIHFLLGSHSGNKLRIISKFEDSTCQSLI